jgi:predicted NACHT family NTPase
MKLTEKLDAVRPGLWIHRITESGPPEERRTEDDIQAIFKQANGRLLILGEPGTGKTNLLMELAEGLIAEARRDEKRPIPIVFSLPRWTLGGRERTLAEWMIDDLDDDNQYGLSRETAEVVVRQNKITPLLDGLDEVTEEHRAACVDAIHPYQQDRDRGELAVCCRVAEYESLPKLTLRTAIRVEKLTRAEVN